MTLTVSVITPSFNQGAFIQRTIDSVLGQDACNLEYLVVDGGSEDATVDILRRQGNSIRWLSEKDEGQAHAVNKGIALTTGTIIGWLNSDDVYYPCTARKVVQYFQSHPDCDVLYGNANHIDEQDGVIEPYPTEPWDIQRLAQVCFLCQPAVFFRRRIVEQHGGLDQRLHYCMDYEYWLRLSQRGVRFHYLPESLSGSRLYGAAKTLRDRVKVHREINCMMRQRLGRVPERWLFNYAHSVLDTNGVCRSRKVRFALGLMVLSWYASLRWNRRLSRQIIVSTTKWMWESSVQALRGCRA